MSSMRVIMFLAVAVWLGAGLPLGAHDLVQPTWRGRSGTTYQEWRFDDADNPALPEVVVNLYGGAVANVTVGAYGSGWLEQLPGLGTQTGYWDIGGAGGSIVLVIDNPSWPLETKEIWVQVTYWKDITAAPVVSISVLEAVKQSSQTLTVETVPSGGYWRLDQSVWLIDPYPGDDQIVIVADPGWGAIIDQIVVDTAVTPPCNDPFADADGDGDVDQDDFAVWQACHTGPDGGVPTGCECFDRDDSGAGDGDIDVDDLAAFEACASGPGVPASAACDG